jgi:hypothetical protein
MNTSTMLEAIRIGEKIPMHENNDHDFEDIIKLYTEPKTPYAPIRCIDGKERKFEPVS